MARTALVISGGGSKGAFAVGALKYLIGELGLSFDVVAGTSTGALIAPLIVARGRDALPTLEKEYTTVGTRDILSGLPAVRVVTGKPSLYDSDPLERRIDKHITDDVFRTLRDSPRQLAVTTVDLRDGKLVYYQTGPRIQTDELVEQVTSREQLARAVHASASIPVAMPPVVNARAGHPDDGYVDGGVREYVPIEIAIDAGATDICCIILAPPFEKRPLYTRRFGSVVDVLQRSVDLLTEEVGASDVKLSELYTRGRVYLDRARTVLAQEGVGDEVLRRAFDESGVPNPFANKVAVALRIIRPPEMLRGDTLKFDPEDMRWNLEFGYRCAKEQWPGTPSV
ncbi:MAG TPA: patatin-like phospholipase family protein [Longimicrobium sp.]|nr:patatin-like phospholipase family protein [Longimicrobium sp.]